MRATIFSKSSSDMFRQDGRSRSAMSRRMDSRFKGECCIGIARRTVQPAGQVGRYRHITPVRENGAIGSDLCRWPGRLLVRCLSPSNTEAGRCKLCSGFAGSFHTGVTLSRVGLAPWISCSEREYGSWLAKRLQSLHLPASVLWMLRDCSTNFCWCDIPPAPIFLAPLKPNQPF
jgi:hypothetical protein